MRTFLASVSLLVISLIAPSAMYAQSLLPQADGQIVRLNANIDFKRGGMSGICALRQDEGTLKGCLFNEFGISALDFVYDPQTRKVRIVHAMAMLNKWYIKRVLRQDLVKVVDRLERGDTTYVNEKRHITYQFSKMKEDGTEE